MRSLFILGLAFILVYATVFSIAAITHAQDTDQKPVTVVHGHTDICTRIDVHTLQCTRIQKGEKIKTFTVKVKR